MEATLYGYCSSAIMLSDVFNVTYYQKFQNVTTMAIPLKIETYYKDNYRREGIRVANARPKVIIFCKSHWDLVTLQ